MKIPFHKPYITDEEIMGVVDSLRSGWLTMGPKTIEFEKRFGRFVGAGQSVSMNSCTACLHLALKAVGIKEGDEVIVPSFTFTATSEVLSYLGAVPVIVDVDMRTHNLNIDKLKQAIGKKTKAVIPVHYAGQPCDMEDILDIARKYKLFVIEDAAHAFPATYKEKMIGTMGDITCFSFYATKTLATGEGGMAVTEDPEWADRMRILRLHGISRDAWKRYTGEGDWYYEVVEAGCKYNMTDIQAALGLAQLKKANWMWNTRKEIAAQYNESFKDKEELITPYIKFDRESAWHIYALKLNLDMLTIGRDEFIRELAARGVGASVHFIPLYRHPYYIRNYNCKRCDYPESEWIYERVLSLPIYPGMMQEEICGVIDVIGHLIKKFRR